MASTRRAPPSDCTLCPRLHAYRDANRAAEPAWHNAPVGSFGAADARLLIVGLAPGRGGANRTGRPFTGDFAGDVLYAALARHGFARGVYEGRPDDGFELVDCRITNAVRCVPPANKPTGAEIRTCRTFLEDELTGFCPPDAVLALGRIAYESCLRALGLRPAAHPFRHGGMTRVANGATVIASYHTSRYNMNTGRLTEAMFEAVMASIATLLSPRTGIVSA